MKKRVFLKDLGTSQLVLAAKGFCLALARRSRGDFAPIKGDDETDQLL